MEDGKNPAQEDSLGLGKSSAAVSLSEIARIATERKRTG
jgi:hypothetical protein